MFATIDDLMGLWPSDAEFARDVGLKENHPSVFKDRRSIPVRHWPAIIEAAQRRAQEPGGRKFKAVTADALLAIQTKMADT